MRRRTERRAQERALEKLRKQSEKLAVLEEGGAPERPIDVESAAQVEPHARAIPCARCGEATRVDEHTAETIDGARLRVARTSCPSCGAKRSIYFRIRLPS
jgi:hypothetical protein